MNMTIARNVAIVLLGGAAYAFYVVWRRYREYA